MTLLTIDVPGEPQPQGSSRAFVHGHRAIVTTDNPRLHQWRDRVAFACAAQRIGQGVHVGPVRVEAEFRFTRPKSRKPSAHVTRPDLDKCQRALGDALTGVLLKDDASICEWRATKRYATDTETAGVRVVVTAQEAHA